MSPERELLDDLDLARSWFDEDIRTEADPDRSRQLRYSLCNKLAADWQKYVAGVCASSGVATSALGNCWPRQVRNAFAAAGKADPFARLDTATLGIFSSLNPVRNAIDHGNEPEVPDDAGLEQWMDGLRAIAQVGLVR